MAKKLKNLKVPAFDSQNFLDSAGILRKTKEFKRAEAVYAQGDAAESVLYLQSGGVKLTVVNEVGKEASPFWDRETSLEKAAWQGSPFAWGRLLRSLECGAARISQFSRCTKIWDRTASARSRS
jgi:hypothetical protein